MKIALFAFAFLIPVFARSQNIYSKAFGDPKNEPVIFIHGGPGSNSATFEATTAQKLAQRGFYVVFYDRRGEGRSVDPLAKYTFRQTFDDLNNIYAKYKLKKSTLIAFSFGGLVSTLYAQQFPERVKSIILTSALVSLPETYQNILDRCTLIYRSENNSLGLAELSTLESMDRNSYKFRFSCFRQASKNGFFHARCLEEPAQKLYEYLKTDTLITRLSADTSDRASYAFWKHEHYSSMDLLPVLQSLSAKGIRIYGIYGKDDGLYAFTQISALKKLTGNDHFRYLDNASHYLYVDRQDEFLKLVSSWCNTKIITE